MKLISIFTARNEESFLNMLRLFFLAQQMPEKMKRGDLLTAAEWFSTLSETYYTVVETSYANLRSIGQQKLLAPLQAVLWLFTWFPLGTFCAWRMLAYSNAVVKAITYGRMTVAQCVVRQNILRRRGNYAEAEACIRVAFAGNTDKPHVYGFLHIGLADVYRQKDRKGLFAREIALALSAASAAEKTHPKEAACIRRICKDLVANVKSNIVVPGGNRVSLERIAQEQERDKQ